MSDIENNDKLLDGVPGEAIEKPEVKLHNPFEFNPIHALKDVPGYPISSFRVSTSTIDDECDNSIFNTEDKTISEEEKEKRDSNMWTLQAHVPMYLKEDIDTNRLAQSKVHKGVKIGLRTPQFGGDLTMANVVEAITRRSSNGTSRTNFLPRSGIWITVRPPREPEIIDFDYLRSTNDTIVGQNTAGMLLSAANSITVRDFVDLILECVTKTSVRNRPSGMIEALKDRISAFDYARLAATVLTTMYPDGYPWTFVCPHCGHEEHSKAVSFARMDLTDFEALNDNQLDTLVNTFEGITDEQIEKYKSEFSLTDKETVHLEHCNLTLHLGDCSLREYLDSSARWVQRIESKYTKALSSYYTEKERALFIRRESHLHRYTKYAHFIRAISYMNGEEEVMVTDREMILGALDAIPVNTTDYVKFEESLIQYVETNTLSAFAHPAVGCEKCGGEEEGVLEEGHFAGYVPLSPDRIFFTLAQSTTLVANQLASV